MALDLFVEIAITFLDQTTNYVGIIRLFLFVLMLEEVTDNGCGSAELSDFFQDIYYGVPEYLRNNSCDGSNKRLLLDIGISNYTCDSDASFKVLSDLQFIVSPGALIDCSCSEDETVIKCSVNSLIRNIESLGLSIAVGTASRILIALIPITTIIDCVCIRMLRNSAKLTEEERNSNAPFIAYVFSGVVTILLVDFISVGLVLKSSVNHPLTKAFTLFTTIANSLLFLYRVYVTADKFESLHLGDLMCQSALLGGICLLIAVVSI